MPSVPAHLCYLDQPYAAPHASDTFIFQIAAPLSQSREDQGTQVSNREFSVPTKYSLVSLMDMCITKPKMEASYHEMEAGSS